MISMKMSRKKWVIIPGDEMVLEVPMEHSHSPRSFIWNLIVTILISDEDLTGNSDHKM